MLVFNSLKIFNTKVILFYTPFKFLLAEEMLGVPGTGALSTYFPIYFLQRTCRLILALAKLETFVRDFRGMFKLRPGLIKKSG